jgi:lipid-A-disaccharide synthase
MKPSVLIVAAEASSALYAQRLLEHWSEDSQEVHAFGIGSRAMEKLGFEILGRSEELAVVGIQEVIAHFAQIRATFYSLVEQARRRKPKFALLLDYPDFNLRLAKKLKALGIPVIYYISPQVWAWRTWRVHGIKKVVDRMLVLFPFEKTFYQQHQVAVDFVGHPLLDEISDADLDAAQVAIHRAKFGVGPKEILLALMPGSRRSELKHHLQVQLATAEHLHTLRPDLQIALLVAPTFRLEEIQAQLPDIRFPLRLIHAEPFAMIRLADVVLCASGTATLMVGLMEKPMVIMYRMNAFTAAIARRFVKSSTAHFGMINLVLGERVVAECFQEQASVEHLSTELLRLIDDSKNRIAIAGKLAQARHKLGDRGATGRVAGILKPYLEAP